MVPTVTVSPTEIVRVGSRASCVAMLARRAKHPATLEEMRAAIEVRPVFDVVDREFLDRAQFARADAGSTAAKRVVPSRVDGVTRCIVFRRALQRDEGVHIRFRTGRRVHHNPEVQREEAGTGRNCTQCIRWTCCRCTR